MDFNVLQKVHTQPISCEECPLYESHQAIGFMNPEGNGSNGVLVIAEALGDKEANDSLPLRPHGPAGSVFQGIIRRIPRDPEAINKKFEPIDRKSFTISNTIWCRPGVHNWLDGAPWEYGAIEHCQQYNKTLVAERRPRAILTLGSIPTRTVTGLSGEKQGIKNIRGFILKSSRPEYYVDGEPIPVIGTFHPSFLHRASKTRSKDKETGKGVGGKVEKAEGGMSLSGVVRRDIQLALEISRKGVPLPHTFEVVEGRRDHMESILFRLEEQQSLALAWDIETPRSIIKSDDESEIDEIQAHVTQIQFALDSKVGYVFGGFEHEWIRNGTRSLLGTPNTKYTWNGWKFDNKVVQGHWEIPILGRDVDLMAAWRWIEPDLPRGLQFATSFAAPNLHPWKHLAIADELLYGACDVIALHLNADYIFGRMSRYDSERIA